MYHSDCNVCKREVNSRSRSIACEFCGDWFHVECVNLKEATNRTLRNKFLVGLCPQCLDETRAWWDEMNKGKERKNGSGEAGNSGEEEEKGDVLLGACGGERVNSAPGQLGHAAMEDHRYNADADPEAEASQAQVRVEDQVTTAAEEGEEVDTGSAEGRTDNEASSDEVQEGKGARRKEREPREDSREGGRKVEGDAVRKGRERRGSELLTAWMGVGKHTWRMIQDGKSFQLKAQSKNRKVWVFGDSIMRGVGKNIYSLSKGVCRVTDKSKPGANIQEIRDIVKCHLHEMEPEDLVVIEGGGNNIERIGGSETADVMEEIVTMVEKKIERRPLVMCIPMRRDKERGAFGRERRWVNRKLVESLEDWGCDGLRLWERMDWTQVWSQDGVHMSNVGKVWVAWNVVEWAQRWEEGRRE